MYLVENGIRGFHADRVFLSDVRAAIAAGEGKQGTYQAALPGERRERHDFQVYRDTCRAPACTGQWTPDVLPHDMEEQAGLSLSGFRLDPDGAEFAGRLLDRSPSTKVVDLTLGVEPADIPRLFQAGAAGCSVTPVDPSRWVSLVEEAGKAGNSVCPETARVFVGSPRSRTSRRSAPEKLERESPRIQARAYCF